MDINSNSLEYFNPKGIDFIFGNILNGLEVELENGEFDDNSDTRRLEKQIKANIKKMKAVKFVKMPVLIEVVDWLNNYNNMDAFGTEGWEHAWGLD